MGENQNMTLGLPGSTVYLGPRCQLPAGLYYTLWHLGQLGVPGGKHLWGG